MTPDLHLKSGFARGVSLSLPVHVTCLHSGSWLLSGFSLKSHKYMSRLAYKFLRRSLLPQGCSGGYSGEERFRISDFCVQDDRIELLRLGSRQQILKDGDSEIIGRI